MGLRRGAMCLLLFISGISVVGTSAQAGPAIECEGEAATVVGTEGPDEIHGTPDADVIVALGGDDEILLEGNDLVCAGSGDDSIVETGIGAQRVYGGAGQDTARLGLGWDKFWGGKGGDSVHGGAVHDGLRGGPGNDSLFGGVGEDYLYGGSGDDSVKGQDGGDIFFGDDGDDTLLGGSDPAQSDYAVYSGAPRAVHFDLEEQTVTGWGTDRFVEIESADGSAHMDTFEGDDDDNTFWTGEFDRFIGHDGNDFIFGTGQIAKGGPGDDYFWVYGGEKRSTITGGLGVDVVADLDYVNFRTGIGRTTGRSPGRFRLVSLEGAESRSTQTNTYIGNAADNYFTGGRRADVIKGGAGNDTIGSTLKETGPDRFSGGPGDDTVVAGGGEDTIWGGSGDDIMTGDGGETRFETENDDELYGGPGFDLLDGGPGIDKCQGEDKFNCEPHP